MQPPISNNTTMYSNIAKHKTITYSTIMMHAIGRLHSAISAQLQLLGGLEGFFTLCLFLRVLPSSAAGVAAAAAAVVAASAASAPSAVVAVAGSGDAAGGATEGSAAGSECDSDVLLLAAGMMSVAGTSVLLLAAAGPVAIVETICSHCPGNSALQTGHLLRIICSVGHMSGSRGCNTHFQ